MLRGINPLDFNYFVTKCQIGIWDRGIKLRRRNGSKLQIGVAQSPRNTSRSKLIGRVILFQFKLAADGIRDLLLSPLSIVAGILGILFSSNDPHYFLNRLLRVGRQSDDWINLFDTKTHRTSTTTNDTLDGLAHRFEEILRNDYEANGLTAKTAQKLKDLINDIHSRQRKQ